MTCAVGHATMWRVTEEEKAEIRADLRRAARAKRSADARAEQKRLELRDKMISAAQRGLGTSDITRSIDHLYAEGHVSRMIHGKS